MSGFDGAAAMERLAGLRISGKHDFGILASANTGDATRASLEKTSRLPGMNFGSERLPSNRFSSERSTQSVSSAKIKLNKTFLEVHDADYEPSQRTRASSDPGTELSSESLGENFDSNKFWQQEMEQLSEHMNQIWSNKSCWVAGDVSDSVSDGMRAQAQQNLFSNCWPSQDFNNPSSTMVWPDGAATTVATDKHSGSLMSAERQKPPGTMVSSARLLSKNFSSTPRLAVNETISKAPMAPSAPSVPSPPIVPLAMAANGGSMGLSLSKPNIGSFGHPELCPRPCIYFARGICAQGADCEYCHLDHSKRPSHLDKRNRETLKAARFEEVLVLSLPLLREKVRKLALNPDVLWMLNSLESRLAQTMDFSRIWSTKALKNLGGAMGCLTLRSLLTALQRPNNCVSPEHAHLEAYVARIQALVLPSVSVGLGGLPDLDQM